uniref:Polyribonucleotide 5'-hydroxyl-kinase Clp1 P-loop domain-containing protein n=1 Tax=Ditylenchus dipsaci TaxID=166011 RepID=A0A915EIK5_9BILA
MIGQTCFMMMKKAEDTAFPLPPKFMYSTDEYLTICSIIGKISLVGGPVLILGNKGVGKSTLMRYLDENKKDISFDTDVGQSEMNPSGCISLSEIKKPLLEINSRERPILFVNTVGWVEGIGHDLMCSLIKCVNPLMLINVSLDGVLPFMVPKDLQQKTVTLKRQRTMNNFGGHLNPAMLRQFLMAGYMAQCFSLYPSPFCVELRLANVLSFRVRFGSVSVYFHPELAHVSDSLILCPLNCAVVALCEAFVTTGVLDCPSLPTRLTLQKDEASAANAMLRCYGFGMIRAIDVERKIFHVITPVEPELLTRIKVFALGHELQTPPIMFDLKGFEPAPYLVELGKKCQSTSRKNASCEVFEESGPEWRKGSSKEEGMPDVAELERLRKRSRMGGFDMLCIYRARLRGLEHYGRFQVNYTLTLGPSTPIQVDIDGIIGGTSMAYSVDFHAISDGLRWTSSDSCGLMWLLRQTPMVFQVAFYGISGEPLRHLTDYGGLIWHLRQTPMVVIFSDSGGPGLLRHFKWTLLQLCGTFTTIQVDIDGIIGGLQRHL